MTNYEFEVSLNRGCMRIVRETNYYDEWGAACLWIDNERGVEYNFCIDNTTNEWIDSSAFYKMIGTDGSWDTETDEFIAYKIDFDEYNWKEKMINAMIKAAETLWEEVSV